MSERFKRQVDMYSKMSSFLPKTFGRLVKWIKTYTKIYYHLQNFLFPLQMTTKLIHMYLEEWLLLSRFWNI